MSAASRGGLSVTDLTVEYVTDGYSVRPLDGLSFESESGSLVVLLGPSGCGKTTLLSSLGGILSPTAGTIMLGDTDVTALGRDERNTYRREQVGFVFQAFNLIPSLTARENIAVPLTLTGRSRHEAYARADALLDEVGLADRGDHKPSQLSGGQQQRVAVARGLGGDPRLLLADEPTANLDHIQAEAVIRLLRELRSDGRLIVVSTHDARLVPIADQIVEMVPEHEPADVVDEGPISYRAGESVFEQGDESDVVYVVESGAIDIVRILADGAEEHLTTLEPGRYFGELGPLLGFPRSASARARADTTLHAMSIREFRRRTSAD